jgi:hypothetical protein
VKNIAKMTAKAKTKWEIGDFYWCIERPHRREFEKKIASGRSS